MKRLIFMGFGLLVAAVLVFSLIIGEESMAISGCCKVRRSTRDRWQIDGRNFDQCKMLNEEEDRDDIFYEGGRIWWDIRCRR